MKKIGRAFHPLALLWIAITVVAAVVAQDRTAVTQKPVVVRGNGPILYPKPQFGFAGYSNGINVDTESEIKYRSFSGGPTNMDLKTYFGAVVKVPNGPYILSNTATVTTSNYLSSDPDWFNGSTNVPLNTSSDCWEAVYFEVNGTAMSASNLNDAALVFLGKTTAGGTNYDSGYTYALQNRSGSPTNFWLPVATSAEANTTNPVFKTGEETTMVIYSTGITNQINTNLTFKSYLASVETDTNGAFYLTNLSSNLSASYFETNNTNYYKGQSTIALQASGTTTLVFKLKSQKFEQDEISDCLLVFVGVSTNTNAKCQVAYVLPLETGFSAATNR